MLTQIPKPEHGSQAWLEVRWRNDNGEARIAASACAAVHGQHPFITMADLANELLSETPPQPKEPNSAMLRGTTLEAPIREWAAKLLGHPLTEPDTLYRWDEPGVRLIATIDSMSKDNRVFEQKTTNKIWRGELPDYWYWQGVQQAICCDVDEIVWGIFDSTLDLHVHRQKVTGDEKAEHMEAVKDFLWYVNLGTIPAEWPATYNEISERFPNADGDTTDLTEHAELVRRIIEVQAAKKLLDTEEDTLKATIAQLMKDAHTGVINGQPAVTWKSQNRKGFDKKAFTSDHPDLYSQYENTTTIRVMRFKGER